MKLLLSDAGHRNIASNFCKNVKECLRTLVKELN